MRVLFLSAYSELAASSRTRVYAYFPFLEKKGIGFRCICFSPKYLHNFASKHPAFFYKVAYLFISSLGKFIKIFQALALAKSYDIVFIQKILFPLGLEKILKFFNPNIIFDFDDAIFTSPKIATDFWGKIKIYFQNKYFFNTLSAASCCIVENEYNKKIALRACSWVEIITGPIDTEKYFVKGKKENERIVIGWTGSYSTTKYLLEIKDVLRNISEKHDVIFRFIGADPVIGKVIKCDIKQWSLEEEVLLVQTFDIGLMPLPDDDWTRGKGGYKLLQYMASGIPAVASPVEINKEIIKDGENGYLASNTREWEEKLSLLVQDCSLRMSMGKNARLAMERNYSLIAAADKLSNIFETILK